MPPRKTIQTPSLGLTIERRRQPSRVAKQSSTTSQKSFSKLLASTKRDIVAKLRYNRKSITEAEEIIVSRSSLTNLPGPTPVLWKGKQWPAYDAIQKQHFVSLVAGQRNEVYSCVVEMYLHYLCQHLNKLHGVHLPGSMPLYYCQDSSFHEQFVKYEFEPRSKSKVSGPAGYTTAAERLSQAGITSESFKLLHHFFIPLQWSASLEGEAQHSQLLVISPLRKTCQFFCSDYANTGYRETILAQACMLIEDITRSSDAGGPWFRPSEWKVNTGVGSQQGRDTSDCTVFVMSNAMAAAFGSSQKFEGCDMMDRRWRIAGEMLYGFAGEDDRDGEFWYADSGYNVACDSGFKALSSEKKVKKLVDKFDRDLWSR